MGKQYMYNTDQLQTFLHHSWSFGSEIQDMWETYENCKTKSLSEGHFYNPMKGEALNNQSLDITLLLISYKIYSNYETD